MFLDAECRIQSYLRQNCKLVSGNTEIFSLFLSCICVCVTISLSLKDHDKVHDCDDLRPPTMLSEDERDVDVESDEDENGERSRYCHYTNQTAHLFLDFLSLGNTQDVCCFLRSCSSHQEWQPKWLVVAPMMFSSSKTHFDQDMKKIIMRAHCPNEFSPLFLLLRQNSGNRDMSLDRRAHHNALERKRRDHIKDSFTGLRDAIPTMQVGN